MSEAEILHRFVTLMTDSDLPKGPINTFCHHLETLMHGESGMLEEERIRPNQALRDADDFEPFRQRGAALLEKAVVIKLNGGLGTGMGLVGPKSLIEVRAGITFLDLIVRQILQLRENLQAPIPLLLMNSYSTRTESLDHLSNYPELELAGLPLDFLQHRVPKVNSENYLPAFSPSDPELQWCPPGHGDIYSALATSGTLDRLVENDIEYAFVSNADNLGAVIDPRLLGFMATHDIDFMMEAADRTESDRKGGHLCLIEGAGLALRELAQCPPEELQGFQDVSRFRYFNTNNLWIHLPSLANLMDKHNGILPLAPMFNRKTVDPRDPNSTPVIHIETAMGSAISLFPKATAVRVSRHRFLPVKATADLLAIRSDAYRLTDDHRIKRTTPRKTPPVISLDGRYYKLLEDFETRFPNGPPSLKDCVSLDVQGDVTFGRAVKVKGEVHLSSPNGAKTVPDGATLTGRITL
jgi:UTP--glucose-1-phosphate uridylyltransferase